MCACPSAKAGVQRQSPRPLPPWIPAFRGNDENERELFETSGFAFARALRVSRAEKGLRLGEFEELSGRREALDRRRKHGVRVGVALGRTIKLRQRQCGAQ